MPRKSRSKIQNVGNISTVWNQKEFLGKFQTWFNTWNQGEKWGIIGAEGRPKTVVLELKEHGRAKWARSPPESIEYGFGNLLLEVDELVKSETILETDMEHLEDIIKNMESILQNPNLNPQNIRFSNVVTKFKEPKREGEEPIIKRTAKWYGHYRTPAFVKYMKWKKSQGLVEPGIPIPEAENEWSNKAQNKANPPMFQAITSLLEIAKDALEAPKELPEGEPLMLYISNLHKGPDGGLHQVSSIQNFAREIVEDPTVYPGGASRKRRIILQRLRERFEAEEFEVTGDEAKFLLFVDGFNKILGTEGGFTIKLNFPRSAGALKSLMREIPGLDLSQITRPRAADTPPEIEFKPGVELKMLKAVQILKNTTDALQVLRKAKYDIQTLREAVAQITDNLEDGETIRSKDLNDYYDNIIDIYLDLQSEKTGLSIKQLKMTIKHKNMLNIIRNILMNTNNFKGYSFTRHYEEYERDRPVYTKIHDVGEIEE